MPDTDTIDHRLLLKSLRAFKKGDFSVRMPMDQIGIAGEICEAFNESLEYATDFAKELDRISTLVGKEGKTSQRATLPTASGAWLNNINTVNSLINDMAQPTTEIAQVIEAVAKGDLSKTIPLEVEDRPLQGQYLKLAKTINTMVEQLSDFANEVIRVAKEVGTEGQLGGQANVTEIYGIWNDLTDNVNRMASNLTEQVRNIADVTAAVSKGDLSRKISVEAKGEISVLKNTINTMVDQLSNFAAEVTRVAREVGSEGKLGGQAKVEGISGTWRELTNNVNLMAGNLTEQVRNIAEVTTAVAEGDLSRQITVEARGEILALKNTINTMVDQLSRFSDETIRMTREVGSEGKLGGQAKVEGVSGKWRDLTNNVNLMAANLAEQVRNIAEVTTAVANGDLTRKIVVEAQGEILSLKNTINTMVEQLSSFAAEVSRVAQEVGTDGKLGGQANVEGVSGTWRDLTNNVNQMASNLTNQVRNIAEVTTAVAQGDLTKQIRIEAKGEIQTLKNTINTMVNQLARFAEEVTRVAREVGTEGQLGGQANVEGVAGTWRELTNNVNLMANNLTEQVRSIAEVTSAVAQGDLSRQVTILAKGEILSLTETINTMVAQLSRFAEEVTRVAREVGTEGQLGGQANVEGVTGIWRDLTNNVNMMATNLTNQVRNIAEVTTAVAQGDLTRQVTIEAQGELQDLKNTINLMVNQLVSFSNEVTRVAREVGTEGKLGGQANVEGVSGTWRDLTNNVNMMATNLTDQVRNIAEVTTAVAQGDLTRKIAVEAQGEILALKNTINNMVDQLNRFATEVIRVAREVGREGKLGSVATVQGVSGSWSVLTDNMNEMASNLTDQVRNIAEVTTAVAQGDFSRKITIEARGEIMELKNTINTMVDQLSRFATEVTRVAREVGSEGKLGGQASVDKVSGTWRELTNSVNEMGRNLTEQVRNIAEVSVAITQGDFTRKITVEAKGEIQYLKTTINTMVDQLNRLVDEVTRVARDVGTEGKLGGQADVRGVAGTWRDLTDNVNEMARNLTEQVRSIADVVVAIAQGNLRKRLSLTSRGEIAALATTINEMIDTLTIFAEQTINVAREVGAEGKLGGQAKVPGARGTWRELTDNVNQLANNLTTQVRAIGEVATAVTQGDLTRTINVETQGELTILKDNINTMIHNLRETTRVNNDQDWLKTNLTRFTRLMQGQRDVNSLLKTLFSELAPVISAQHGVCYLLEIENSQSVLKLATTYAYQERKHLGNRFLLGENLVGQCALEKQRILLTEVPADYIHISSGLGKAPPLNLILLPVQFENTLIAVIELASFNRFNDIQLTFLDQLADSMGVMLNTINSVMRTEALLTESQSMAKELQAQQRELEQSNQELEQKQQQLELANMEMEGQKTQLEQSNRKLEEQTRLLEQQNFEVERKNKEVEIARLDLENKAEELARTSKYKSQFLTNMSHELRTPLNSLLVLAKLLSNNESGNLTDKQVEYAQIIHTSGTDLLNLINEILDISKIEAGAIVVDSNWLEFKQLQQSLDNSFRQMAQQKNLTFEITIDVPQLEGIYTDAKRLYQILKNLLSNAFKFTEHGGIQLKIYWADTQNVKLTMADFVIAFAVIDTGIGIPESQQKIIFEAFQQADGGISRKYGGTGLGLAISREIARLLNGKLELSSSSLQGSTFTFYLPQSHGNSQLNPVIEPQSGYQPPPKVPEIPTMTMKKTIAAVAKVTAEQSMLENELNNELNDDRNRLEPNKPLVLIIEDDHNFARLLIDIAHEMGFQVLMSSQGEQGLAMANQFKPDAITLDIVLPTINGWTVLDLLKHNAETRHIPVQVISVEPQKIRALRQGAIGFIEKPLDEKQLNQVFKHLMAFKQREPKSLLVVEDNDNERTSLIELLKGEDIKIIDASNANEALQAINTQSFDCIVLDLRLPDMDGVELLEHIKRTTEQNIPIIIYTGKELEIEEQNRLQQISETVIIKGAKSPERLLNETALFLHRVEGELPASKRKMLTQAYCQEPQLVDKKVLVVDDDIRNIFALTGLLESQKMQVFKAEDGKKCLALLQQNPEINLILMDIMMPELDGYETIRRIRQDPRFGQLPIIALTAKAMKGDREKCIEAGASDYISKPVDNEQLLSLLRVWLYENRKII